MFLKFYQVFQAEFHMCPWHGVVFQLKLKCLQFLTTKLNIQISLIVLPESQPEDTSAHSKILLSKLLLLRTVFEVVGCILISLPVNDDWVGGCLVSVSTAFFLTAAAEWAENGGRKEEKVSVTATNTLYKRSHRFICLGLQSLQAQTTVHRSRPRSRSTQRRP